MKYRIYSRKANCFTDSLEYPSNQRTWSEFIVNQDGQVIEFVTTDGENFFKELVNQEDYQIKIQWNLKNYE